MNKVILFFVVILYGSSGFAQTTAVNFSCADCNSVNHELFAELNAGKIIVLDWVMPCGSCVGPSKTAYNIVQSYATSNPGKVFMYIADDYANTNCASLNSWVDANGLTNTVRFSNAVIRQSDYGSLGMPKIVVIGGYSHKVYYNEINSTAADITKLQNAINAALLDLSVDKKLQPPAMECRVSPNPAANSAIIHVNLKNSSAVTLEVWNTAGQKVRNFVEQEKLAPGVHDIPLSLQEIPAGVYYVKVFSESGYQVIRLVVTHE